MDYVTDVIEIMAKDKSKMNKFEKDATVWKASLKAAEKK